MSGAHEDSGWADASNDDPYVPASMAADLATERAAESYRKGQDEPHAREPGDSYHAGYNLGHDSGFGARNGDRSYEYIQGIFDGDWDGNIARQDVARGQLDKQARTFAAEQRAARDAARDADRDAAADREAAS